jgi:hypothetical protein
MSEKSCVRCGVVKPLESFTKNSKSKSGYSGRCKDCHRKISAESVANNPHSRKASCVRYYLSHREVCKIRCASWVKKNPVKVAELAKKARLKEKLTHPERVKLRQLRGQELSRKNYPLRYKARCKVNNAVASGKIPRAKDQACHQCGLPASQYHHHAGYEPDHWLDVIPVCFPCHRLVDGRPLRSRS